jgi:hypothetical protein
MSKLFDFRQELATMIAAADIGFTAANIIIKRQGDLYNDIATSIAASKDGVVLHIGIASGTSTEEDSLEMDVVLPVTIIALPQLTDGARPEEELWEALVMLLHDYRFANKPFSYRLKFQSFEDLEIGADDGTEYLGRRTDFKTHLSL